MSENTDPLVVFCPIGQPGYWDSLKGWIELPEERGDMHDTYDEAVAEGMSYLNGGQWPGPAGTKGERWTSFVVEKRFYGIPVAMA